MSNITSAISTVCTVFLLCFATVCYANPPSTQFEQLYNINKEWINQNDLDPSIYSNSSEDLNEIELIQKHLSIVESTLRKRTTDHLSIEQKSNRIKMLDVLNSYWRNGVFPKNIYHKDRTPYFIDHLGTHCAVGHLLKSSGFGNVAKDISELNNYIQVNQIKDKRIDEWTSLYGFSKSELAWIQPFYCNGHELFVSEFKYAEVGEDINEFVEIVSIGGYDSLSMRLELYDQDGNLYASQTFAPDINCSNSVFYWFVFKFDFPTNSLTNDGGGIAISSRYSHLDDYTLSQFISYGGEITGNYGIAHGVTSDDCGFTQSEATLATETIGRIGGYCNYSPMIYSELIISDCAINPGSILPVELTNFDLSLTSESVLINWETSSEVNSEKFLLKRSQDGRNFETIYISNTLSENGEGASYTFEDKGVKAGQTYYYQLTQIDLDGTEEKFEIQSVSILNSEKSISIYPNPSFGREVNIDSNGQEVLKVEIFNIAGSLLSTRQNTFGVIDISNLNSGVYIMNIYTAGKMVSEKVIIQ